MNDPAAVCFVERVGDFDGNLERLVGSEGLARKSGVKRLAFQVPRNEWREFGGL